MMKRYFIIISLVLVFISCQKREWNNPFDAECPKELYTPTSFSASLVSNAVKLSWSQSDTKISGFVIERSVAGGVWVPIATPDKYATTWADTNLSAGKVHAYHIVAKAGTNLSNQLTAQITPLFSSTITTTVITKLLSTSAILGGNITNDGGASVTARGVCWNTSSNPTTFNSKTSDGTGSGAFTSTITGLTTNTTYYVRAYAINSIGTTYGNEITFKTYYGEVADIDGNIYPTVKIGNQIWMVENLKTTRYNDGTAIPNVTDNAAWAALVTGAYCWYNNEAATYKATYGALYNWYTVSTNKLAPAGWHVPTDAEWTTLTIFLGGENVAGGKLKETGFAHWVSPNMGATNETGFTGLPSGLRDNGVFYNVGKSIGFWTSTIYPQWNTAQSRTLGSDINLVYNGNPRAQENGISVRCILGTLNPPSVTTAAIINLTTSSATCGGTITSDGGTAITAKGVCWSTLPNPTTTNSKTSDGTGLDSFISNPTGFAANTTYYMRAYATNSVGTAYGNQVSFTALPALLPVNGLVAWYPFIGNANDESGNGNHGTINGATLTSSRSGTANNAYSFSGSNFIYFGANTNLVPDNFSISGWFKASTLNPDINVLIRARWNGYSIHMTPDGKIYFNCSITGENLSISSVDVFNDNKWHNFVASFGNYTCKFYVDASLIGTKVGSSNKLSYVLGGVAIGRDGDNNGWFFNGSLDDFGIWNRALTDQEVQQLFNMK